MYSSAPSQSSNTSALSLSVCSSAPSLSVYSSAPSQNKFGWLSTVLTVFDESTKMPIKQSI